MASLSRFKGSLVGAVLGDCIGAIYECNGKVKLQHLLKTVAKIEQNHKAIMAGLEGDVHLQFTDDTAMARSVTASLIASRGLDIKDMARRFSDEYYLEPDRGYGGNVITVFTALRKRPEDVFEPARRQFEGQGSYGNGAAMRIAPAALFCLNKEFEYLKDLTTKTSKITHSHRQGIQGAILQSCAVDLALRADPSQELDRNRFLDQLIGRMQPLEEEERRKKPETERKTDEEDLPYCYKLKKIKEFLKKDVSVDVIEDVLGNNISALGSVPAAVYSFLRSYDDVPCLKTPNRMTRTILFAIHLGGDTDTIATMAAAIAGAFYGYEEIPQSLQACCEGVSEALDSAQALWDLQGSSTGQKAALDDARK